jgi:putative ABC transport system permease protein
VLGVDPIRGRVFNSDDDRVGAAPVVILGGGFCERRFGCTPDVVGKSIDLNGVSYAIVGVMPATFSFYGRSRDVYTPIGQWNDPTFHDRRVVFSSGMVGRLKPGVTLAQARADMDNVARNLAVMYPEADKGIGATLVSMKEDMVGDVQPVLLVLLGAVAFLQLIACANIASLLLARCMARSAEFAIRASLGASRKQIVRQLLTESLVLAAIGGTLGLAFALWGTKAALGVLPSALPRANDISVDGRVLLFTAAMSVVGGILFGITPAFNASRVDLHEVLKAGGRGSAGRRHWLQELLVVVAIAMALVLLVGAGLMTRSLSALWHVDPGFNPSHALTFSLSLPASPASRTADTRASLRAFDAAMQSVPGVEAVSVTLGSRPMQHTSSEAFWVEGRPKPANINEMNQAMFYLAEAGFAQAMGIRLQRGRFITPQDDERAPVVIVIDDVFARMFFSHENPVGQHIHLATFNVQAEIVGVVGHVKQLSLDDDGTAGLQAQFYYPFMQLPDEIMRLAATGVAVVIRAKGDPAFLTTPIRGAIAAVDPRVVVYNITTLDGVVANSMVARTFSMMLLSVFASLALVLACIGVYGVLSFLVERRTREIGLRVALGAERADVLRLILAQGLQVILTGVLLGVLSALSLTRFLSHQLFGVGSHDPATFAEVALLIVIVAVLACYIPARRAMKVDPIIALQSE